MIDNEEEDVNFGDEIIELNIDKENNEDNIDLNDVIFDNDDDEEDSLE